MTNCVVCGKVLLDNESCSCGTSTGKDGMPGTAIGLYIVGVAALAVGILSSLPGGWSVRDGIAMLAVAFVFFALAAIVSNVAEVNRNTAIVASLLIKAERERSKVRVG